MSEEYKGMGISSGLDRGMLVYRNGKPLIDEGMGMGAVSVSSAGFHYFASIIKINHSRDKVEVVLTIDKMLIQTIYGIQSKFFTLLSEKICTSIYKERETYQRIGFSIGAWINFMLRLKVKFITVAPLGQFVLNYQVSENTLLVDLSGDLERAVDEIYVMNELSAARFHAALKGGKTVEPPTGWQLADAKSQLYCEECGLAFSTKALGKPKNLDATLYWGREFGKDHCWAGFIYKLQTTTNKFQNFRYAILFQERGEQP